MWTQLEIGHFDIVLATFVLRGAYKTALCRASGKKPHYTAIQLTWAK